MHHLRILTLACTLITSQDRTIARTFVPGQCRADGLRKNGCILKPEVGTLSCQRMNGMCRITYQRNTRQHIFFGMPRA